MAHIHEKIDWTVQVFIVFQGKVLIRQHDKYNILLGIGGHIELDEDQIQAAKRECLEEVGLAITIHGEAEYHEIEGKRINIPPPAFMNRHCINETHEHIDFIYFATSETDHVIPENVTDTWSWYTKDEVTNHPQMSPEIKKYAITALDTLTHMV